MINRRYINKLSAMLLLLTPLASHAALLSRMGGQAVYDDDLNVTWITDANLALRFNFGLTRDALGTRFTFDGHIRNTGVMTFTSAQNWISGMNSASYLGANDWRLPSIFSTTGAVVGEFNHLFFTEFNGITNSPVGTPASPNLDFISNLLPFDTHTILGYWNESFLSFGSERLIAFSFRDGVQTSAHTYNLNKVWVLRNGDIALAATVPVPATIWLFGSGLIGLAGFTKRHIV